MLPCAIKSATCGSIFDPARIRRELAEIETKLADPALWSNPNATKPLMRDKKRLENLVADDDELVRRTEEIATYFELAREGEDVLADLERDIKALSAFNEDLEARTMLNGEADPLNAIVTVHPGAGGTESQDWAEMLMLMYLRWAEQQGFKTEINDYQDGEEAGIKSATFTILGENAFGQLAGESGVHRLVRISPFDQAKRRHTSFASVYVSPEIDDTIQVDLKVEDLRIDTYRSGGKGGQHVNTTDSAVRSGRSVGRSKTRSLRSTSARRFGRMSCSPTASPRITAPKSRWATWTRCSMAIWSRSCAAICWPRGGAPPLRPRRTTIWMCRGYPDISLF